MKLSVIKIGGNVLDEETSLEQFLDLFASVDGHKILIHGGGKLASQMLEDLNIPVQMINGRRVTNNETLKIINMVYAGHINKNIVAQLHARRCNAFGMTGADGNLIQAHKRISTDPDYGFAGDIDAVNTKLLENLVLSGLIPVVAPITHDCKGQLLNTNADTIARQLAQAMGFCFTVQLIYCFEKSGVLKDINNEDSVVPELHKGNMQRFIDDGTIHSGMLPKITNAFEALDKGVNTVSIGKWDQVHNLIQGISGTKIITL